MCGIIGVLGKQDVADSIVDGLRRLEYRGYDSAGVATVQNGKIVRVRTEGKLMNLDKQLRVTPAPGHIGIGHTRWATHGVPSERNAHPIATDKVAIVHNGIIENYQQLRNELQAKGYTFTSDTDTEVMPVMLTALLADGNTPHEAMRKMLSRLEGAYAIAVIFADMPDILIGARKGSPLAVGYGDGEMYLGSDALALAPLTSKIAYLEEGDWVELTREGATFYDKNNERAERQMKISSLSGAAVGKDGYRHFMLKEIYEQPTVIGQTLHVYYNPATGGITLPGEERDFIDAPKVSIVACGTSYYAGMVASYWFERYARVPADVMIASEFRYRHSVLPKGGVAVFISQSGETADTLAALRLAKAQGQRTIAVVNAQESSMAHEADVVLHTLAGPEIGVASTKAFTTQLAVLASLAVKAGMQRGELTAADAKRLMHQLEEVPARMAEVLAKEDEIHRIAIGMAPARDVMYLGRGTSFPIALEGALKLKEISYIHAEGYAAGELKHGPIALIDEHVPVVAIAPSDELFDKTASNIQEVVARGGKVILLSDAKGIERLGSYATESFELPAASEFVNPLLYAVPVQLLAYHVAVIKGTDVDQPRNLAKSVTVE